MVMDDYEAFEMSSSRCRLLFCDTFSHGHDEEEDVHLDLVGFPQPVCIQEIRVIPHGYKVHTNIPESEKIGETIPSSIKLETFVKNLNNPEARVFERLGILDFVEGKSIQMITNSKVATNVILLRGRYKSLTVALYGDFKAVALDPSKAPPPPPPVHESRIPRMPLHPTTVPHLDPNLPQPVLTYGTSPRDFELDVAGRERRDIEVLGGDAGRMGRSWHDEPEHGTGEWHMKQEYQRDEAGHEQDVSYAMQQPKKTKTGDGDVTKREDTRRFKDKAQNKEKTDLKKLKKADGQGDVEKNTDKDSGQMSSSEPDKKVDVKLEPKDKGEKPGGSVVSEDVDLAPSNAGDDLFESLSSEDENMFDLSNKRGRDEMGYENIESDEEYMDDYEFEETANLQNLHDLDIYGSDDAWMSVSVSFNPYQCYLGPLESLTPITDRKYNISLRECQENIDPNEEKSLQAKKLLAILMLNKDIDRDEKWVSVVQDVPPFLVDGLAFLKGTDPGKEQEAIDILVEWSKHALNLDEALKLPIAVNIRMLKAGMELVGALCQCSDTLCKTVINSGVQEKLIDLLNQQHMASSMKLKCIQALDLTTDLPTGMEHILGWDCEADVRGTSEDDADATKRRKKDTLYEQIIEYLLTEQTVRVATAIKSILRKIHFYEAAANFQFTAENLTTWVPPEQEETKTEANEKRDEPAEDAVEDLSKEEFDGPLLSEQMISQQEVDVLTGTLEEIFCVLENAEELIVQPSPKSFPTSAKLVENTDTGVDHKVYNLLASRRFLESMLVVMSSPAFCDPTVYTSIRNLLFQFLLNEKGLLFLASDPNTLNGMIRILTQSTDTEQQNSEAPQLSDLMNDPNARENCTSLHLGLLLIYHLQTLQGIDQLFASAKDGLTHTEMDSEENRSTLHTLYSMTFTTIGKAAVFSVLSQGNNLGCLLPFVLSTDEEDTDSRHRKPVSSRYASNLILLTLQNADNMKMLEKFGSKLLLCIQKKESDAILTELSHWVAPLKHIINLDLNAVANLVEFIKSELDHFKLNAHIAKGMLTGLRILQYITCPQNMKTGVVQKDLKCNLAIINLFSANALDTFIQVLNKLAEILMGPWRQNQPFSSSQCLVLVSLAVPLLHLIDRMLEDLISCGTIQFKDTRLLHGVFALHTVLCSLPPGGVLASFVQRLQSKLIGILLKFTSPVCKVPESEEAVKATTWCMMVKELFQYTVSTPQAFLSGLIMLSELLPVPFPVHSMEEPSSEEVQYMQTQRVLWMLHLSVLIDNLRTVFESLVGSCSQLVHHYLQKVCGQLVDLGLTTAVGTVRLIVELFQKSFNENKETEEKPTEEQGESEKSKTNSNIFGRILSLLSYAVSQPGGKAAFLHFTRGSKKGEDPEYPSLLQQLLSLIEGQTEKADQLRVTDYVLSLLQSLCDSEISLTEFEQPLSLQHLSNSLPSSEMLHTISEALVGHLRSPAQSYASILQVIRALAALTEHDIGAYILKKTLMHHHTCIHDLLSRLAASISSANAKTPDPDMLSVVSTLLGLVQLLLPSAVAPLDTAEELEERPVVFAVANRTVHVSFAEMRALLRFTDIESQNSLNQLETALTEKTKDEESFGGLLEEVKSLIETLSSQKSPNTGKETEIELSQPESIQTLFQRRVMYITALMDDTRMGPSLWLAAPEFDDFDPNAYLVKCDLEAMAEKYCPGFNLKEEVEKGFIVSSEAEKMKQRKKGKRRLDPLIAVKGEHVDDTKRLRLDASFLHQRGRANSRGNWRGRGGGRGVDLFRSRKQNTSRPPSMHVDDFMVMEKHDPAVSGTPQSNKPILKNGMPPMRGTNSEPRPGTAGGFATGHGRWGGPHPGSFRRDVGQNLQPLPPGQRAFDWMMSRAPPVQGTFQQYGRVFPRQSEWNPPMQSPYNRVQRESPYIRSPNRGGGSSGSSGGYWAGPKPKEDNRFFPVGAVTGYRQGRGGMNRHVRTNTR